ncbi:hypothetical protein HPP92_026604 [Vanilla planifolia]|uniref:C3H1-type domain-containing protein n=1 Tax=Vanilla planifolia TaxID=51239 RepID=A0A835U5V3_VANPL|nr:hypothetical protein HPP92_026822 [Vanilla planifolia]KAG0450729.1 hypothetical protein HPP92_026604 [Vanilla planifolia]
MEPYGRSPVGAVGHSDPNAELEESMWRLELGGGSGYGGGGFIYPERPGEPDCAYYLRTGACGYGERCRYNHPLHRGSTLIEATMLGSGEYPERIGQPICEYYIKTGTCKFGSSCKYHHPRQGTSAVRPATLNYYGYPLRPGEKDCSYFMKTGQCKFGSTCKFHHPQPIGASAPSTAPVFYPLVSPPTIATTRQYPQVGAWQVGRSSSALPGTYIQSSFGAVVLPPGIIPVPGWNPYLPPLTSAASPGGQQAAHVGSLYRSPNQLSPSANAYPSPYSLAPSVGPSTGGQNEQNLPQRPGLPVCRFYMRTGECKFGATCKYHHPPDWSIPSKNCTLNPLGLPLRPGVQLCAYYSQHGVCKFGPTCKFDHPIGTLGYNPSSSSLVDIPVAPYPIGLSMPTLAPSSLMEQRPALHSSNDAFSAQTSVKHTPNVSAAV